MGYKEDKTDYAKLMNEAASRGDYAAAWQYEQQRNAKIANMDQYGMNPNGYTASNTYQNYQTNPLQGGAAYEAAKTAAPPPAMPIGNPSDFNYGVAKPTYQSPYSAQIDQLLNEILNNPQFAYEHQNDPLYQQYAETYKREGDRAMQDTMGMAAANTGGLASSYAVGAANQANNYYMAQLSDKIPQLEQQAYGKYMDALNNKRNNLGMMQGQDDRLYGHHRDDVGDWYNDKNFAYGQNMDQINRDLAVDSRDYGRFTDQRNWDYGVGRDAIGDKRYDTEWQYGVGRDQLADDRYSSEWDYKVGRDAISDQNYAYEQAFQRWATTGKVSQADAAILGVPAGTSTSDQAYRNAQLKIDQANLTMKQTSATQDQAWARWEATGKLSAEDAKLLGFPESYAGMAFPGAQPEGTQTQSTGGGPSLFPDPSRQLDYYYKSQFGSQDSGRESTSKEQTQFINKTTDDGIYVNGKKVTWDALDAGLKAKPPKYELVTAEDGRTNVIDLNAGPGLILQP